MAQYARDNEQCNSQGNQLASQAEPGDWQHASWVANRVGAIQRAQVEKTVKDSALNVFQPNMIAEPSATIVAQSMDTQTHYEHAKPDKETSKTLHLPNTSNQQNIEILWLSTRKDYPCHISIINKSFCNF